MKTLTGIGLPFPPEYSSCSSLSPKTFRWTAAESDAVVYIDGDIEKGLFTQNAPNKYGWLCESRDVCNEIREKIISNISAYKSHFRAIFTCDESLLSDPFFIFSPPGSNLPWVKPEEMKLFEKSKTCSMICSDKTRTEGHRYRLEIAGQMKDAIDLFGGAHGSQRIGQGIGPTGEWWRSKLPALADYRFSIVFENAVYDKYYTEKITDCFATGTVPIYWGTRKVAEDFNKNGIIFWDDFGGVESLTQELYESMTDAVHDNFNRVNSLVSADDLIFSKIRELT
jgi:hypothetical protein